MLLDYAAGKVEFNILVGLLRAVACNRELQEARCEPMRAPAQFCVIGKTCR